MKLENKIAVITGGASGIGAAGTRRFSAEGATVIILDVNEKAGNALTEDLANVFFIKTDISDEYSVKSAFEKIAEKYGRIDILYNNASVFLGGRDGILGNVEENIWKRVLSINLDGTYHCTNNGECTWYEFAAEIARLAGFEGSMKPCTSDEYPTPTKRPAYSSLDNMMLRLTVGDEMRSWQDAIAAYFENEKKMEI